MGRELYISRCITVNEDDVIIDAIKFRNFEKLIDELGINEKEEMYLENMEVYQYVLKYEKGKFKKGRYSLIYINEDIENNSNGYRYENMDIKYVMYNMAENYGNCIYEYMSLLDRLSKYRPEGIELKDNFMTNTCEKIGKYFMIYDCGAGLCTAILSNKGKPYFIYDMGNTNYFLNGDKGKDFDIDVSEVQWICISHRHYDHYSCFIKKLPTLKKCNLIINDNFISSKSIFLNKVLNSYNKEKKLYILNKNDDVYSQINNDMNIELFNINNDGVNSPHVNNICMKIFGKKNNILLTGDNFYDDIPKKYSKDIKYICASHHGGKYYYKDKESIPKCNIKDGHVIFSASRIHYGFPCAEEAFYKKGWKKQSVTADEGNIEIEIN